MNIETPFERMKRHLLRAGFELKKNLSAGYGCGKGFYFEKNKICGYFAEPSGNEWYWTLDGKIAGEHKNCFDKWSRVPFFAWLPETELEAANIILALEFVGSKEGYEISNNFGYFPYEKFGIEIPKRE